MKKLFLISEEFVNSRLDRWFRKNVCELPQSLIEKNIRKKNIKVNNKKKKSSYKLQKNDQIFVSIYNLKPNKHKKNTLIYKPSKGEIAQTSSFFIENNENFVVLNKPAGVAVQAGTKSRRNILDILRNAPEFAKESPYTVHRIDKETTGILIVAKNRKYAQLFTSLFRLRKIHKTYLCIALGQFQEKKGVFIDKLFHYEGNKKVITRAITNFEVIDTNNNYSFLKLNPLTGRKHQLRKQLLIRGHPILGDTKYRMTKNYNDKKNFLMLHSYKINFSIAKNKFSYYAELPMPFKKILKEKYLKIL